VWSQTVCLCKESRSMLKEKETVSDEFCWHLSKSIYVYIIYIICTYIQPYTCILYLYICTFLGPGFRFFHVSLKNPSWDVLNSLWLSRKEYTPCSDNCSVKPANILFHWFQSLILIAFDQPISMKHLQFPLMFWRFQGFGGSKVWLKTTWGISLKELHASWCGTPSGV